MELTIKTNAAFKEI